ncbi:MAG: hypothetical protein Q9196_003008, partial [Gyalolechia fulgens]
MAPPSPAELQYQRQHGHDDRSGEIIGAFGVCLGFAIIAVLLRFVARHLNRASLGGDDWTIVVGLVGPISEPPGPQGHHRSGHALTSLVDLVACYRLCCVSYGLGKQAVRVTNQVALARAINASVVCYISSLSATKISILLLYRRIFPNRTFHALLWAVGILVLAYTIANVFYVVFECNQIKAGFNQRTRPKCINDEIMVVIAILTTVTDFIILCLPLPL